MIWTLSLSSLYFRSYPRTYSQIFFRERKGKTLMWKGNIDCLPYVFKYVLNWFLEREGEIETLIRSREKHPSGCNLHAPCWRWSPPAGCVPWPGMDPQTSGCMGRHSSTSHTGWADRAIWITFMSKYILGSMHQNICIPCISGWKSEVHQPRGKPQWSAHLTCVLNM